MQRGVLSFNGTDITCIFVEILSTIMSTIDDKATVELFVNGEQAEQEVAPMRIDDIVDSPKRLAYKSCSNSMWCLGMVYKRIMHMRYATLF